MLRSFFFRIFIFCLFTLKPILSDKLQAQKNWFEKSEQFSKTRFYPALGLATTAYTASSIALYQLWYKDFDRSSFHLFNDWKEWRQMDKFGHLYSGYFQTSFIYTSSIWTGLNPQSALWLGIACSQIFQTTIELMDAHSSAWGFSWGDMAFNALGSGLFAVQQRFWKEQKFQIKFSYWSESIDMEPYIKTRTDNLFGNHWSSKILKNYNHQTYWLSFHPFHQNWFPEWIHIAVGYGASGMLGGFKNEWSDPIGHHFILDHKEYPRYSQYFLSFDINLEKIPVRNPFLKSLFKLINIIKFPAPALEINSLGQFRFHALR